MSSPREREKRDRRESRGDEREGQGRKRNRNESEETEEIKTFPLYPYPLQGKQALPNCKPISAGRPGDLRYTAPNLLNQLVILSCFSISTDAHLSMSRSKYPDKHILIMIHDMVVNFNDEILMI